MQTKIILGELYFIPRWIEIHFKREGSILLSHLNFVFSNNTQKTKLQDKIYIKSHLIIEGRSSLPIPIEA